METEDVIVKKKKSKLYKDLPLNSAVYLSRLWSMAVAYVGRACLFSIAFLRY